MIESIRTDADAVYCRVRIGDYGHAAPLINVKTKAKSYDKTKEDAELVPHFAYFYFPSGKNCGILLTERRGLSGIYSNLTDLVENDFKKAFPGYTIQFAPLMPAAVLQSMLNTGNICEARFKSYTVPTDVADKLLVTSAQDDHEYEVIVRAKGALNRVPFLQYFQKQIDGSKILEDHSGVSFDEIRLEIEMGDRRRTVNLGNVKRLKAAYDIDTSAFEDGAGFPKVKEFAAEAESLAAPLAKGLP